MSYQYVNSEIAAGYNNAAGLLTWESIVPPGDIPFLAPVIYGSFMLGQEKTNTDGSFYYAGFSSAKPVWGYVTEKQFYYIFHTINSDKYWSFVTAKFRQEDPSVWHVYNAILKIEQLPNQGKQMAPAFKTFTLSYTRLVQLS